MNNLVEFKASHELDAIKNVRNFITFCRDKLTIYDDIIDWNSSSWKGIAAFRKLKAGYGLVESKDRLDSDFIDFAKSYIRYNQALSSVKTPGRKILALRCLEKALLQTCHNAHVYNVSTIVLDEALQIASKHYKSNVLHQCGYELQKLSIFLSEHRFVRCGFISWTNPVKPRFKNNYLPEKEDEDRIHKLPDERALFSIAEIFSRPDEKLSSRDLFTTSVIALLMCSPSRASEILALPADCEITRKDRNGVERYGLRYYAAKGGGATIKWIPDVMIPVAQKAVLRLLKLSENARSLARWCERSPDKFYRHPLCPEVDEHEPLDVRQVCHALGYRLDDKGQCINKLKRTSLDGGVSFLNYSDRYYTLHKLWKLIRKNLPQDFPWLDKEKSVRYSNALCLLNLHQCHEVKMTACYTLYKPSYSDLSRDIEKSRKMKPEVNNIFKRHGYFDQFGKCLFLRTHQPRHLLNTIAQLGDLSQLNIAKWSGRVSVLQNKNYNHTSQEEILEKINSLKLGSNRYCSPMDNKSNNMVVLENLAHGAVHLTSEGYCIHNYVIPPCRKLAEAQAYGWEDYGEMNEQQQKEVINKISLFLKMAKQAVDDGFYGADKWVSFHEDVLNNLEKRNHFKTGK